MLCRRSALQALRVAAPQKLNPGTLVAMKKPRPLDHSSAISIQVGPRPWQGLFCTLFSRCNGRKHRGWGLRRTVLSLSLQSEPPGPVLNPVAEKAQEAKSGRLVEGWGGLRSTAQQRRRKRLQCAVLSSGRDHTHPTKRASTLIASQGDNCDVHSFMVPPGSKKEVLTVLTAERQAKVLSSPCAATGLL